MFHLSKYPKIFIPLHGPTRKAYPGIKFGCLFPSVPSQHTSPLSTAQTSTCLTLTELRLRTNRIGSFIHSLIHSFIIHSIGICRIWRFLAVLRSFFHSSLLYTLSFHPFPPTSLPSSLTYSCHLFLGLPLSLVVSKYIILFWEFCFLPYSVHAQINVTYLTLLSLL